MEEKITVVIPAFNPDITILETLLASIFISQSVSEVIIIDDCSDFNVEDHLIQSNSVKIFRNDENLGLNLSRYRGVGLAKNKFVAFHDCDDISINNRFDKQIQFLLSNSLDVCFCGGHEEFEDGRIRKLNISSKKRYILPYYLRMVLSIHRPYASTMLFNKEIFTKYNISKFLGRNSEYIYILTLFILSKRVDCLEGDFLKKRYSATSLAKNYKDRAKTFILISDYIDFLNINYKLNKRNIIVSLVYFLVRSPFEVLPPIIRGSKFKKDIIVCYFKICISLIKRLV